MSDALNAVLTELAQEALVWLRAQKQNPQMELPLTPSTDDAKPLEVVEPDTTAPPAKKRGRPPKGNNAREMNDYAKETEPEISEDESLPIALATAKEFVQRFSNAKPDGLTQARAILAEHFKVGSIPGLTHAQRVELIGMLKAKLAGDA